jgi:hypothetical protein
MTIRELHELTGEQIANGQADAEVAIDYSTFIENDNGNILTIERAALKRVQGADDAGPVGAKFPFFVLEGEIEWHTHGDPL